MVRIPDAAAQVRSAPVKALRGFFAGIGQLLITADRLKAEEAQGEQTTRRGSQGSQRNQTSHVGSDQADYDQDKRDRGYGENRYEPLTAPRGPVAARYGRGNRAAGRHRATSSPGPAASAQSPTRRFRSLDSTGNVRLLTSGDALPDDDASGEALPDFAPGAAFPADIALRAAFPADTVQEEAVPVYGEPPVAAVLPVAAVPAATAAAAPAVGGADLPVPGYDQLTLASLRSRLRYLNVAQLITLAEYERATASRPEVIGMFERRIAKLQAESGRAT